MPSNPETLLPCPFCGGSVSFHASTAEQDQCDGCHYIQCSGPCGGFFDFSAVGDPKNESETLETLRARIVPIWNRRAVETTDARDAARYRAIRSARIGVDVHAHCEIWNTAYVGDQLDAAVDAVRGALKTSAAQGG